jgi:cysteine desulfurase
LIPWKLAYFDHNATTPVAADVLAAMLPALTEACGNPSSIHRDGQRARQMVETARRQVAARLGCSTKEIVFTSGGTEANNLALSLPARHVVTSAIEHPAVAQTLARRADVTVVAPDRDGLISPAALQAAMRPETDLVSIMHANNEFGTVQPLAELAAVAHEFGALFHSDGVQAPGRMAVDVAALGVDLYTVSGHKMYAPKGIGALYVRKGVELAPQLFGGRHESGRRAGTENVPGIVALGAAAARPVREVTALRDRFEAGVLAAVPEAVVQGAGAPRLPNTANIRFAGLEGEALVIALDLRGFSVSSGAACSSGAVEPSPALLAIGLTKTEAKSCIRFSLGESNTLDEVEALIGAVTAAVAHLRKLSPTYV